ncbi:MAG: hypothetical protein KY460_00970 [Actinobacteria bacterium]|nr:hypothetical protein [Actinomycetota bacterium]
MDRIARNIGRGVVAGFVGTVAMTVSSTLEAKLRDRGGSSAPGDAARTVLGIEKFNSDAAEQRFSQLVHWGYGTGWGVARGLLRALGLGRGAASVTHFALVYGGEQVMLPALDVTPPATQWGATEIAIDAWHHLVYVGATAAAFEWLTRRGEAG